MLCACVEVEEMTVWKYRGAIVHGMDFGVWLGLA